ncbi:hypothetical protein LUZ60_002531 [Juncus effusus]|nr:hypothetical protein LUZ60_002531 [Juncus effusus]
MVGQEAPAMAISGDRTLIFTYGTLKRGFSNHKLIQSLIQSNHASFVSPATTSSPLPLVCGPYRVPFLLNSVSNHSRSKEVHRVSGELYSVTAQGLARLDELEGVEKGHYERLPLSVRVKFTGEEEAEVKAEGYFGHRSYAAEMWRRSGEKGLREYTKEVATGYVRRLDRPEGMSFLDHIRIFVQSSPTHSTLCDS